MKKIVLMCVMVGMMFPLAGCIATQGDIDGVLKQNLAAHAKIDELQKQRDADWLEVQVLKGQMTDLQDKFSNLNKENEEYRKDIGAIYSMNKITSNLIAEMNRWQSNYIQSLMSKEMTDNTAK